MTPAYVPANTFWLWPAIVPALALLLSACAQMPQSVKELDWKDRWGDRGEQVLARDYAMCLALVEQRRSLLSSCMDTRGWYWETTR